MRRQPADWSALRGGGAEQCRGGACPGAALRGRGRWSPVARKREPGGRRGGPCSAAPPPHPLGPPPFHPALRVSAVVPPTFPPATRGIPNSQRGQNQARARPDVDPRAAYPGWGFASISDPGGPRSRPALLEQQATDPPHSQRDQCAHILDPPSPAPGTQVNAVTTPRTARACGLSHAGASRARTAPLAAQVTPCLFPSLTGMNPALP